MGSLRKSVFWPPFILLVTSVAYSLWDGEQFIESLTEANDWMLSHLSWGFSWGGLAVLFTCVLIYFSPIGRVRIGGKNALPMLTRWRWFAIALCTNTAVGILFWATAEPIYHFKAPPASLGIPPLSDCAAEFAMASLFHHWSLIPCAMYALPALMFALCFYNLKQPFSITSSFIPLMGERWAYRLSAPMDAILLFTLVSGMSASLATGILTIAGGLQFMYGWERETWVLVAIGVAIVCTFVISSASGLQRGIRILSDINIKMFFFLIALFLLFGPTQSIFTYGWKGATQYGGHFLRHTLFLGFSDDDPWPQQWTVFYWAVWLAWAPVTGLFLGRIGRGYSVREFLVVNLIGPAIFALVWMSVFGGVTLSLQQKQQINLVDVLKDNGPERIAFEVFNTLPLSQWIIPFFLLVVFIAYVTAADSNTTAIAGISSKDVDAKSGDAPLGTKIAWGVIIGSVALIMVCQSGIAGIRTISYLGGAPALAFELLVVAGFYRILLQPKRFDLEPH